jgi:nucleotide-binding universal stress UspA family protein
VKLLVVTHEPITAEALREAAGEGTDDAEVLVVSPASNSSPLAFWMSDADEAIAEAERAAAGTVESLEDAGIDAVGDTGEGETGLAIQDALATFPADRIVIFTPPEDEYRAQDGLEDAEARFGVPVTFADR